MTFPRAHDYTFNPQVGCRKLSEGCKNCYMFLNQTARKVDPTNIRRCTSTWGRPVEWQKEAEAAGEFRTVFTCGYSDFFLPEADAWRDDAWALIRKTPNLIHLIPSKRTNLIADRLPADWGAGYPNVWLGTSCEMKKYLYRLDELRAIPCVLYWLDFSPCLEPLMPELGDHIDGYDWVNVSGEQGCGLIVPRPFNFDWAREIRDLCAARGIAFSFPSSGGKCPIPWPLLDGVRHNNMPKPVAK
jgi:protein gp37